MSSHVCSANGIVRSAENGRVAVELEPPARCKGCDGACLWYRTAQSRQLTLVSRQAFPVGAAVTVTLPEGVLLLGAVLVYGLPLAALLAGAALGAALFATDLAAAGGAALGLSAALAATAFLRRRLERVTLRRLDVQLAAPR